MTCTPRVRPAWGSCHRLHGDVAAQDEDHVRPGAHEVHRDVAEALQVPLRRPVLDDEVLSLDVAELAQRLPHGTHGGIGGGIAEEGDAEPHRAPGERRRGRARGERRRERAADERPACQHRPTYLSSQVWTSRMPRP